MSSNYVKMIGVIITKDHDIYIRYDQQHNGHILNVHYIEIDPEDKQDDLNDGQVVEFEMSYGKPPTGKNYAKIKK